MNQVKIIFGDVYQVVQDKINDFIKDYEVLSINTVIDSDGMILVTILYK